jgi:hypothetical protein
MSSGYKPLNKQKEMVGDSAFFFTISVVAFTFWPVMALVALSGVLRHSYGDASTTYFNPWSYSQLMPSAGHVFTLAIIAAMYIHRGVSAYAFDKRSHLYRHTVYMTLAYPLYAAGLIAWCYDQPWVTFGLTLGAYLCALTSYVADGVKPTTKENVFGGAGSTQGVSRKAVEKIDEESSFTTMFLTKFPIRALVVFLYFETFNAFFGAATLADPDFGWNVNHYYVLFQSLLLVGMGTWYFVYLNYDAVISFMFSGYLIQLAVTQRDVDPTGYLWIVTYAFAIFEILAGLFALSYSVNLSPTKYFAGLKL